MPNLKRATDKQIKTLEEFIKCHKIEYRKDIIVSDINNFEAKVLIRFLALYLQIPQTNIGNRSREGPKNSKRVNDNYTSIIIKYFRYNKEKRIFDTRIISGSQIKYLYSKLEEEKIDLKVNIEDLTSTEVSYIINYLSGYCPFIEVEEEYLIIMG